MTQPELTLRALYEEHFQFVWRSLRRLGVREADVPDAVQDVFIVVHRKLAEFEGRSKVTTWLFGIALRVARDRQKLAYGRRRVDDEDAVSTFADDSADAAADLERKQGLELLEAILDGMPLEQRAVFTLFELEGLTGEGIAELLEVPLGTVYSRLRLAREAFQRAVARLRAREAHRAPPLPPPPRPSGIRSIAARPMPDDIPDDTRRAALGGAR
ncbi:MAG: RNA polymerase sigma factor [Polyangiaceae bacterium]|jgi:RNA polymerase sigma-70 factor (ECF subfamily)|nr:RNA polymerase sigma factor [Polyangiaceae bacterium]MBK8941846.1 RNA polymerase sigma factor [Polyangiaceae bacterium]